MQADPTAPVTAPADPAAGPTAPRPRLAWVDAARGWCVVAVVLFHVIAWSARRLPVAGLPAGVWDDVNMVLGNLRMPVLLAVSGLVLSRAVRAGASRAGTVTRAAGSYYLYLVWVAVYVLFYLLVREPTLPHRLDLADLPAELVVPTTPLWYVLALAVYVLVLPALQRVPAPVVLTALVVLSTGSQVLDRLDGRLGEPLGLKVPSLFLFFALGVHAAPHLRRLAERSTLPVVVIGGVLSLGLMEVGRFVPAAWGAALYDLRGVVFLVFSLTAVAWACRWAPVRDLGQWLGRRTLGVYVLHPLLIALLLVLQLGPLSGAFAAVVRTPLGGALYPLAVTAVLVATAIGLQHLAERTPARVLFAVPAGLRARVAGTPPQPAVVPAA
ncbi:acyltransferase family protein [Cellulomonas marina]|uniref:Fucose 4-O-acetylase n=1 Tax=Cellulomonas marina TaxID=988821 RepID=A0A1I0X540_9CELL|nr:acyltransferase [Cellulomonas marina]GIG28917.1 hypothetical protein Cma02nite_15170 [Cellulomonas marina]SFA95458.1 Fucose 4-O-acetylase [Cellulomonas marina]